MTAPAEAMARESLRQQIINTRRRGHQFYIGVTVLLIASVVSGFWASYYSTLLRGGVERAPVMHVHGAVFSGWLLLLLLQVGLAASGRVKLHRRVGTAGIWYGGLVLALGCIVTIAAPVMHVRAGRWTMDAAASVLLAPFL